MRSLSPIAHKFPRLRVLLHLYRSDVCKVNLVSHQSRIPYHKNGNLRSQMERGKDEWDNSGLMRCLGCANFKSAGLPACLIGRCCSCFCSCFVLVSVLGLYLFLCSLAARFLLSGSSSSSSSSRRSSSSSRRRSSSSSSSSRRRSSSSSSSSSRNAKLLRFQACRRQIDR